MFVSLFDHHICVYVLVCVCVCVCVSTSMHVHRYLLVCVLCVCERETFCWNDITSRGQCWIVGMQPYHHGYVVLHASEVNRNSSCQT